MFPLADLQHCGFRQLLREGVSHSALGAFYQQLPSRMDKQRTNTANIATAHKLARLVHFVLTRSEAFVDQGQQRYAAQHRGLSIPALKRSAPAPSVFPVMSTPAHA